MICDSVKEMGRIASAYFEQIFSSREPSGDEIEDVVRTMRNKVDHNMNQDLARVFTASRGGKISTF